MKRQKEYRVINLVMEYGQRLNGCKYAVASSIPEAELRKKNCAELSVYEPFIYLTEEMGDAIVESQSNESKHVKRKTNNETCFEEETEQAFFEELAAYRSKDPCELLLGDDSEEIKVLSVIKEQLTDTQLRRLSMRYKDELTLEEIGAVEGVNAVSVKNSLDGAIKKLRKLFQNYLKNTSSNSQ